ncbi:MAG: hypothetical protein DWQ35_02080 [Planctomycetota bacterium]|nr:MAG: hypothetical protein DWQ35_02080 [Planctomycetota bacterium]REK27721.1 MAG: hypothetical protein DWQ42_07090 [Planctomycetota bacterium]REK38437.1 MAG: hypothetical protein DWQ46_20095 [Planctomycetota bacterium]
MNEADAAGVGDEQAGDEPTGDAAGRSPSTTPRLFIAGAAFVAALFVVCIFSPRYSIWLGLYVPEASFNPEIKRASVSLVQVDDPFLFLREADKAGLVNKGLAYRLFFPLLAHYLNLPDTVFLALPHLGCLLVLALVAQLTWRETGDRLLTFLATLLFAALPWFFVSTGWLSYFDSYWVLGLLVVGLVRSRTALLAACLIVPWIDERFLLGLPLAVVVRALYVRGEELTPRRLVREVFTIGAVTLPYVIWRIVAAGGEDATAAHFNEEWSRIYKTTARTFRDAMWSGFRGAWIFLVPLVVVAWNRQRSWLFGLLLAGILLTTAAGLLVAADMSRGLMMLVPAVLAGCLLWLREVDRAKRLILCGIVSVNLMLPLVLALGSQVLGAQDRWPTAHHVLWYFKVPIHDLHYEWQQLQSPPWYVNARYYFAEGMRLHREGKTDAALHFFDNSVRLDANFADGHYARAALLLQRGERAAAVASLEKALQVAEDDWPAREECRRRLRDLKSGS